MFRKNEEITLSIDNIGNMGEGIAHVDGYTLFVKDAIPGDTIRAKILKTGKSYGYARLIDIITPSGDRVVPPCPNASRCGGCTLQHMSYEKQLEYKERKVKDCLIRIGGFEPDKIDAITEPIMGMDVKTKVSVANMKVIAEGPFRYRNKAQFPVGRTKDKDVAIGFYAGRTHSIIDADNCMIQCDQSNEAVRIIRRWMEKDNVPAYDEEAGTGLVRHILTRVGKNTGDVMVCLVLNEDVTHIDVFNGLVDNLKSIIGLKSVCLNINTRKTNVILGEKIINLYGSGYIEDTIGNVSYRISPLSFFQVNPVQTEKLYATALRYAGLSDSDDIKKGHANENTTNGLTVWDLYCGIGTISLFLAKKAGRVLGVEIVPQAVKDAKKNAEINRIDNAVFLEGAAEVVCDRIKSDPAYSQYAKPDLIVVDPPRKGCDEKLMKTITDVSPEKVVYISCDPATLARDLRILCENGYMLNKVRPCDMFAMTGHVESCVLLERVSNRKADSYVKLNVKMEDYYRIKDAEKKTDE